MRLLIILAFTIASSTCLAQFKKKPLWQDEFNGTGTPNLEIWTRANTTATGKSGDPISGYCPSDENAYLKDGYLHLRLYHDATDSKKPYKSGRLMSKKNIAFKYGKVVIRAKASAQPGVWPALWLRPFGDSKQKVKGEIDMLEYINAWKDSSVQVNFHLWGNFQGKEKNHVQYPKRANIKVSDWHIYQLEIYKNKMIMRIDKKEVYSVKKGELNEEWPFGEDWQLLLAHAYGGWAATKDGIDDSQLPAEFLIDYVRYYPLK